MKRILLIFALIFALLTFSACAKTSEIPPKSESKNLEFWITENVEKVDFSKHKEIYGWFGARQFYGLGYAPAFDEGGNEMLPEIYVTYLISAWPDYAEGGQYITEIEFTDPKVEVFGLSVNSSFEEFERVFNELGYEVVSSEMGIVTERVASKDGISFSLRKINEKPVFSINAKVTNRENIIF